MSKLNLYARAAATDLSDSDIVATMLAPDDNTNRAVKPTVISELRKKLFLLPTLGDIFYAGTSGAITKLAGNTTATRKFLIQAGTGSASAAPNWDTISAADLGTTLTPQFANLGVGVAAASTIIFKTSLGSGYQLIAATQGSSETSGVNLIDIATTWNNSGNTPTAFKLAVTNTASNGASLLMDLQVGGTSQLKVALDGSTTLVGHLNASYGHFTSGYISGTTTLSLYGDNSSSHALVINTAGVVIFPTYVEGTGGITIYGDASSSNGLFLETNGRLTDTFFGAGTMNVDGSGTFYTSSDERLKTVEGDFVTGLAAILAIHPKRYKWNADSGLNQTDVNCDFIAQDIQAAIVEAVTTDNRGYLGLRERTILAAVINAIKELDAKITAVSAK